MTTFRVVRKSDGAETTRYAAMQPVEQLDALAVPFADFDHVEFVDDAPAAQRKARRLTKLHFVGLLGSSFAGILAASKASVDVEMFVKMLDWATPEADGTSVDLDDPRVTGGLTLLESGGLLPEGKAWEILHG